MSRVNRDAHGNLLEMDFGMRKFWFVLVAVVLAACEKAVMPEESGHETGANLVLRMEAGDGVTRGSVGLGDVCGRLNVAVFDAGGTKVKTVAQSSADASFGLVSLAVAPGTYRVVAVGHNCGGSATITNAEKVTFPNNKVTDTFSYCGEVTVGETGGETVVTLHRVVAMLRLTLTGGSLRDDIASLKFYYTGGSSTLSPLTGFGCVNSRQTEVRAFNADGVYEVFTFPHETDDVLTKVTITAYDAGDNELGECVLENVPVHRNRVTNYTGDIFGGGGSLAIPMQADAEWGGEDSFAF